MNRNHRRYLLNWQDKTCIHNTTAKPATPTTAWKYTIEDKPMPALVSLFQ